MATDMPVFTDPVHLGAKPPTVQGDKLVCSGLFAHVDFRGEMRPLDDGPPKGCLLNHPKGPDSQSRPFSKVHLLPETYTRTATFLSVTASAECVPVMSNTMRPSIAPACIRLKISLMSSSFSAFVVALTIPSPAKASASARSRRVPTMEPRMVKAFNTTSKMGRGNDPGGRP